jgi:hypothetical protein
LSLPTTLNTVYRLLCSRKTLIDSVMLLAKCAMVLSSATLSLPLPLTSLVEVLKEVVMAVSATPTVSTISPIVNLSSQPANDPN